MAGSYEALCHCYLDNVKLVALQGVSSSLLGLALKNQSSSDNPVILAIERYLMTSCKSRL